MSEKSKRGLTCLIIAVILSGLAYGIDGDRIFTEVSVTFLVAIVFAIIGSALFISGIFDPRKEVDHHEPE